MTHSLASGGPGVRFIGALLLSQLTRSRQSTVVDGLKDPLVELTGLGAVKRVSEQNEGVGQTLYPDPNGTMSHVGPLSLRRAEQWVGLELVYTVPLELGSS